MYAIKAIYDGTHFKLLQPIPVKENYEVVITFIEPLKTDQAGIMDFFGIWDGEDVLDIERIIAERKRSDNGGLELARRRDC